MRKRIKMMKKREKEESELWPKRGKTSKRELFLRIMRELRKSEDILIRENGTRIRI